MEKAIGLGHGILVQGVIPGRRLTVATGTTSEGRGQERIVHEVSAIGILGADKSTVKAVVRNCQKSTSCLVHPVYTYLGDRPSMTGEDVPAWGDVPIGPLFHSSGIPGEDIRDSLSDDAHEELGE